MARMKPRQVVAHLRDRGWQIGRKVVELDAYQRLSNEARSSLRMIHEAVELCAPARSVAAEERVEPPLTAEAEALVKVILKLAERR